MRGEGCEERDAKRATPPGDSTLGKLQQLKIRAKKKKRKNKGNKGEGPCCRD